MASAVSGALEAAGIRPQVVVLPDGEEAKRLAVVEQAVEWLTDLGVTREAVLLGVGGGALTDLAGFVAAVYLRGITAHYVPTTLLGAVDASIGGKTGVNVAGKNLVGVFRHPARVVVDVDVIDALPTEIKRQGAAEALKAGLVADPELVSLLERDGLDADMEAVVLRSLEVKAAVVAEDFLDTGVRAHLNYGHTVGHAVEATLGLPHGSAIAVGMVAAGRASALLAGFEEEDRQREAIAALGLPLRVEGADPIEVRRYLDMDKKRDRGGLRMVLLARVGEPLVSPVPPATVDAALEAAGIAGVGGGE